MTHFSFFSQDTYEVVVHYVQELALGELDQVFMYPTKDGAHYFVCYTRVTSPTLMEVMRDPSGEKKLIYGENEHGYPLYWKIWW